MEVGGSEHLEVPDAGLFPRILIQPVNLQLQSREVHAPRWTGEQTALDRRAVGGGLQTAT